MHPAVPDSRDPSSLNHGSKDLSGHHHAEPRLLPGLVGEEVQQLPLRHHRDVVVRLWECRKVTEHNRAAVGGGEFEVTEPPLREGAERLAQTQLVHEANGRGVDGVASEIPEKVRVLLQDRDSDPRPCQE